ncbi:hypothetical protein TSTA_066670 [Talaromyces stipitatus ATCC 10500]|uniref:HAT C-terminal dimerisation domain-containing protein n=1 Tax=Talaromyces stipitatus (strain ATCC 10500 / CBS 375.48 / QM 6759 / NRRL 1006) TaxID=441959 RepID=B8LXE0_TALSN|nr:uncharacterized protein TSTA_066670 [Talaromyces stipitatus ATCC 10500]EED23221.1 hypothetical protein TSTA_066670 [Talaromyces stipitatus ATCC 10500]
MDEFDLACVQDESQQSQIRQPVQSDKLTRYLDSTSGAGVERLFNSARDICHYCRGSLQPQTISDLMMYMCTSQFEIHEEKQIMLSEYLLTQEIQAAKEERTQQQITVDPISDNEEDEGLSSTEPQETL